MAVLFDDASTEYLFYNTAPVSALGFTIACWAYDDATALNDRCMIQMQASDVADRYARLSIGDDMNDAATALPTAAATSASGLTANSSLANSSSNRTLNQWHHFMGTYASGSRFAYLDGVGGTENTVAGDPFSDDTFDSISIASERDSTPGDEWSGGILWPAVWDKVLNADERLMAASGVHPTLIAPGNLVFFAPLDNAQGYRDWISGVAPTVNGTPVGIEGPGFVESRGGILVPQYEEEQGIYYVGGAANGSATATDTSGSVTHGLDIQAGDVIVLMVHVNGGTNTISDNNGANAFTEDSYAADLDHVDASSTISLFTRVAGASEPASYSFNGWTAGEWSIVMKVFRGVDTSNHPTSIWSVAPASSGFTSVAAATTLNCANITLKKDEDIAVIFGGSDSLPFNPPTLNQSYESRIYDNVGRPLFGYHRRWERGATNTPTFTWTGTNDMFALHFALRPAPDPRPYFVDGATATDPLATSITVTVSGIDIQANDVVIAHIHSNEPGVTILDNNGANSFTDEFQEDNPSAGTGRYAIFSRVAGASEPTTYSFNYSGATDRITCNISVYRNVDTTDIWDVKPTALTRSFQSAVDFVNTPIVQTNARNSMGLALFNEDSGRTFVDIDRGYGNRVQNASPDEGCATFSNLLAFPNVWEIVTAEMSSTAVGAVNHQVALLAADHSTDARYIGFSAAGTAGATSVAVDVSAIDIKEDDFILAIAHTNNNPTVTITNFTSQFQEENPSAATSHHAFLYKIAGASEPSSYTFDWGTTERATCIIMVFRNINTTSPWEVAPSASTRTQVDAATTLLSPSLTTTSDHTIGIAAFFSDAASVSFSSYSNGYFNEAEDSAPQEGLAVVSRPYYTPGNKGPVSATVSASGDIVAHHFALKEAPAASAVTITDVANSGETPGSGSESWDDGSTGNVITGTGFL